ncbi:MAG: hypothetical protein P1U32_04505 [Legionellaceae bacterium]|nr:hypothetical protein [Legionellaceae bacterium]
MPDSAYKEEVVKLQADIQDLLEQNERAFLSSEALDEQRKLFMEAMQSLTNEDVLEPIKEYEALVLSGGNRRDAALKNMILEASQNPGDRAEVEKAVHCLKQYEKAILSMKRMSEDRVSAVRMLQNMQRQTSQSLTGGKPPIAEKTLFIMQQDVAGYRRFFAENTVVLSRDTFEADALSKLYHEMTHEIEAIVIPARQMRLDVRQPDALTRTYRALQTAARQVKHAYEAAQKEKGVDSIEGYQTLMERIGGDYNAYLRAKSDYEAEVNHRKTSLDSSLDGCEALIKDLITIAMQHRESVITEEMYESLGALRQEASNAKGRADIEKTEKEVIKFKATLRGEIENLSQRIITNGIIALTQKQRGYLSKMSADKGAVQFKERLKAVGWPKNLSSLSLDEVMQALDATALKYQEIFSDYVAFSVEKEEVSTVATADVTDSASEFDSVISDSDAALRSNIEAYNAPEGEAAHLSDFEIDALLGDRVQKELAARLVELSRVRPKLRTHLSAVLKTFGQCDMYDMIINPSVSWIQQWFAEDAEGGLGEGILERLFSSHEMMDAFYLLLRERVLAEGSSFETVLREAMPTVLEHMAKHPNVAPVLSNVLSNEATHAYIQAHNTLPFFLYISTPDMLEEPDLVEKRVILSQLLMDEVDGERYQTIVSRLYGGTYHLNGAAMAADNLIPFFLRGRNHDNPNWVFQLEAYPREKLEVLTDIVVEIEGVFRHCIEEHPGSTDDAVSARRLLRATQNKVLATLVQYPDLKEAANAAKQVVDRELRMKPSTHKMLFNGLAKVFGVLGIPFGYYEKWKQITVFSKEKVKGGQKPSEVLKGQLEQAKARERERSVSSDSEPEEEHTTKRSQLASQLSRILRRQ